MKKALCINSIQDLAALTRSGIEYIETRMVDREICENPEHSLQQIIPYVVFYTTCLDAGKIKILQYLRPEKISEDRLQSKTSVGFGGHIDQIEDLVFTEIIKDSDLEKYKMSLNDIVDTCILAANRETKEELGINIIESDYLSINERECIFFSVNSGLEVDKVHTGFLIPVKIEEENYEKFRAAIVIKEDEIKQIDNLTLNFDVIISSLSYSEVIPEVISEISQKSNLEKWSEQSIAFILHKEINNFIKDIEYADLLAIHKHKISLKFQPIQPAPETVLTSNETDSGDNQASPSEIKPTESLAEPQVSEPASS